MRFSSTRGTAPPAGLSEAIRRGAAPDGGLYVPEDIPRRDTGAFDPSLSAPDFAAEVLAPFFEGDALETALSALCRDALDVPAPLRSLDADLHLLELHHGPTGAFKDFGARFLMACLDRMADPARPFTVLAATSGDTGGAVGCAGEDRPGVRVRILYPKGRVSPFQERQLTCWRAPGVEAFRVDGDFDACQRLVKEAFADDALRARHNLTSANSINLGRLLPQATYLAHASARLRAQTGRAPGLVIPTGNLGHAVAALYARALGAPIGPVVIATNANPALETWARTGRYRPQASIATPANAMDVGAPSNFERLAALPATDRAVHVIRVGDDAIRERVRTAADRHGVAICPHTAVGLEAHARLPARVKAARPWIGAATAHAYKFADVVEPWVGRAVAPSDALAAVDARPSFSRPIRADLSSLENAMNVREDS